MRKYSKFLDDGFVLTSSHEPIIFYRRCGRININAADDWEQLHTENTAKMLKKQGVTVLRSHFHKGFGFEIERLDREKAAKLIDECHKQGLKVQTYIAFQSAVSETISVEEPGYDDWIMRDRDGHPLTLWFNQQNFRNLPCLNRDGFWENLKRASHAAIVEAKTDAIGYDNVSWSVEPEVCHCDACKKGFTEFLQEHYPTKEAAIERFGHAQLENILPPVWNYYQNHLNLTEIRNPAIQEWIEFKTTTLKHRIEEMYNYCKSLNPDVLVEINASMQTGQNDAFHMGIYQNDLANGCDAFWNEVDPEAGYHKDGTLTHKIRIYKSTHAMGKMVFTGHRWNGSKETINEYHLGIAESMAFQNGSINCIGMMNQFRVNETENLPHIPLLKFSRANRELYYANPVPFVHLYESRQSLCYSNFESQYANVLMTQVLLRENLPFGIIHSLDELSDVRTILLSGAMCLSEKEIDRIIAFVENGGGLVLTGEAGEYNEKYVGLANRSLKSRLGVARKLAPFAISFGKGRVAVFPRLASDHDFDSYDWVYRPMEESQIRVKFESWEAPHNMCQIADSIRWTLNYDMPAVIKAPEAVVSEMTTDGNTAYVHLLNYDANNPARLITITFRDNVKGAELICPLSGEVVPLTVIGGNSVAVDEVGVYAIVKVCC